MRRAAVFQSAFQYDSRNLRDFGLSKSARNQLVLCYQKVWSPVPLAPPCHDRRLNSLTDNEIPKGGDTMEGGYINWMGQPVILRVLAGNLRVPLRGRLVSESNEAVRLRISDSWDVDIFKSMVVAIEQDTPVQVVH